MHIIVCEDEDMYKKSICGAIEQWTQLNHHNATNITVFSSSEDLLMAWQKGLKADILFLDILFGDDMDGMEIAKQIRMTDDFVPIVFVTNTEAYMKEGYTVRAFRYLNKPVCFEDLSLCLEVAYKQHTLAHNEFLIISDTGRRLALRHEDILYIEAQSPHTLIHMQGRDELIKLRYLFQDLKTKLSDELFIPCHRSYIVNIAHVRLVRRNELTLSTGQVLPISRLYTENLNNAFDSYYQEGGVVHGMDNL